MRLSGERERDGRIIKTVVVVMGFVDAKNT
jgi:hypothetical protein